MPNWCHDFLTVRGDPVAVRAFVDRAGSASTSSRGQRPLTFTAHVPEPPEVSETAADADLPGWYRWRLEHWGCKGDADFGESVGTTMNADSADVERSLETLGLTADAGAAVYRFLTPNSPPLEWLLAASRDHPALRFVLRWADAGSELAAEETVVAGELVTHDELAVEDVLAPEELWF